MNDIYKPDVTNKTYNPVENGIWKGTIETSMKSITEDIKEIKEGIEKINGRFDKIEEKMSQLKTEIAVLQVKSGIWGFLAGLIPAVVVMIYWIVSR
ncbi:MAG TPA: hypothetical protein PL104_06835 [Caldisericia bacterium]|nr:hypothetical protein [Caldisericia bacterium]HQP00294.1 hypothetical protein [Caldisericia bacterium]